MRLYSLPKQIVFTFNPNDVKIQSVLVDVLANNALSSVVLEFNDIELNMEQALTVDIAETFGANDIAIYPLFLNYFKFNISADTEKKEHVIDIKSLQLIYDEVIVEIEDVIDMNDLVVYPSPATDYIVVEGREGEDVKVYDLDGRCLRQFVMHNTKSVIDVSSLPAGTYIIKSNVESCKVIIK